MTIYIQYDPTTADSNNHVNFSSISQAAPGYGDPNGTIDANGNGKLASGQTQITFPDGTSITNMMLDLSQNPPVLIPAS